MNLSPRNKAIALVFAGLFVGHSCGVAQEPDTVTVVREIHKPAPPPEVKTVTETITKHVVSVPTACTDAVSKADSIGALGGKIDAEATAIQDLVSEATQLIAIKDTNELVLVKEGSIKLLQRTIKMQQNLQTQRDQMERLLAQCDTDIKEQNHGED